MALIDKITAIADGFRTSRGITNKLSLDEMAALAAENVGGSGGGGDALGDLLTGTLTEYSNDKITTFNSVFCCCSTITAVSFPACISIPTYAFSSCSSLKIADFPACTTVGSSAFYKCSALETINFPSCEIIYPYAFSSCRHIENVDFPKCQDVKSSAFGFCEKLKTVNLPVCSMIGNNAFYYCTALETISLPACTSIGSSAFRSCTYIKSVWLLASSVCTLADSTAFWATGITSGRGSIFVPASLVDAYKSATNWAYFSSYIASAENAAS